MNIPTKTLKNGFSIPTFGLGTWGMGGFREIDKNNDDAADIQAIKNAINLGVTHIDTAELYAAGHTDELIKEAVKGVDRSQLFITTKVSQGNQRYQQVKDSLKNSLKRLGMDYVDLFLLHAPSPDVPVEETMKAMDELVEEGLTKNIGVSNFTVKQMQRAQEATKNKIVVNQMHYNLMIREVEDKGILKYCQESDVLLMTWRPLQKGELLETGKDILGKLSSKYERTPAQVAINWLISQKNVVVISKTRSKAHLLDNLGAVDWKMDEKDVEYLRNEFPNQQKVSDVSVLKEWEE